MIGIDETYTHFDTDLIIHINSVLLSLDQLGLLLPNAEPISDSSDEWSDLVGNTKLIEVVKSYVSFKVRLMFDPPTSESLRSAIKEQINELEWRLTING